MKQPVKPKTGGFQAMGLSQELFRGVRDAWWFASDLHLHFALLAIMAMGYKVPTPVQRKSMPVSLAGADVVVMARTGSGKTAAFLIPVIEKLGDHSAKIGVRSIILSPTRELAVQTLTFARKMSKFKNLRIALLVGGDSMDRQFAALADNPDIIIATPGRLMHHLQEVPEFTLRSVEVIVFDEADRLFEMGFAEQLREIMRSVPEERQSLLFSATMPKQLVQFARAGLKDPALIRLDTESKISTELSLAFFTCRSADKPAALLFLLREVIPTDDMTIIFVATRHHAEFLHELLKESGTESSVVYGSMDQEARSANLEKFRKGKTKLLLVTDVAARGIDVPLLNNVVNYAFPPAPKLFVHRVGRAARQGRTGTAYSIVEPEEIPHMLDLHLFLGRPPQNVYSPGAGDVEGVGGDGEGDEGLQDRAPKGYEVTELTPDLVHYGNFPQQVMDGENESLRELLGRTSSNLMGLQKVCENAMKQYRKTRPDPSGRAIARSKELDRGETHPLLVKFEARGMTSLVAHAGRNKFLRAMSSFRPKETIFELLGGGGTEQKGDVEGLMGAVRKQARLHRLLTRSGGSSPQEAQAPRPPRASGDTGDARGGNEGADSSVDAIVEHESGGGKAPGGAAGDLTDEVDDPDTQEVVVAEKERVGGGVKTPLVAGGSGGEAAGCGDDSAVGKRDGDHAEVSAGGNTGAGAGTGTTGFKRKLSRFERKQLKKRAKVGGTAASSRGKGDGGETEGRDELAQLEDAIEFEDGGGAGLGAAASDEMAGGAGEPLIGKDGPGRFADKAFYIAYGTTEEASLVEAAMQPRSVEKSSDRFAAGRLEEAILDVNPDEAVDMAKKKRMLHWDSRKKKFVKTSLAELGESKGSKKIRTESGAVVSAKKAPQGEMYAKWKRESNRAVGREGDEEDVRGDPNSGVVRGGRGRGRWRIASGSSLEDGEGAVAGSSKGRERDRNGRVIRSELRTKDQIRKAKTKDENTRLKNLPKAKRRAVLKKRKEKEDPRKQLMKKIKMKGHTRSRMRVKI